MALSSSICAAQRDTTHLQHPIGHRRRRHLSPPSSSRNERRRRGRVVSLDLPRNIPSEFYDSYLLTRFAGCDAGVATLAPAPLSRLHVSVGLGGRSMLIAQGRSCANGPQRTVGPHRGGGGAELGSALLQLKSSYEGAHRPIRSYTGSWRKVARAARARLRAAQQWRFVLAVRNCCTDILRRNRRLARLILHCFGCVCLLRATATAPPPAQCRFEFIATVVGTPFAGASRTFESPGDEKSPQQRTERQAPRGKQGHRTQTRWRRAFPRNSSITQPQAELIAHNSHYASQLNGTPSSRARTIERRGEREREGRLAGGRNIVACVCPVELRWMSLIQRSL